MFYCGESMSWVASELQCERDVFYMECVREPPHWFLWVWQADTQAPLTSTKHHKRNIHCFFLSLFEQTAGV